MRLDLSVPDYTTLSRRSQHLRRRLRPVPPGEGLHLVLDSTGLSIVGTGEWAAAKHGGRGRRGWRKLHLGVDQSSGIRVHTLTEETGDDATTALNLLTAVEGPLVRVTADAAYDTVAVYETAGARVALLHEYPLRVGRRGLHFSGPRMVQQSGRGWRIGETRSVRVAAPPVASGNARRSALPSTHGRWLGEPPPGRRDRFSPGAPWPTSTSPDRRPSAVDSRCEARNAAGGFWRRSPASSRLRRCSAGTGG